MVLTWSLFSLAVPEASEQRAAAHLGYSGATVRVIAIPAYGYGGPERLTAALADFAAGHGASIAYAQSYDTGLVALLDEHDRFRNGEGSLAALLDPGGPGGTAALSTALGGSASGFAERHLPEEVALTGTFQSDVMFDQNYPMVLLNVDARPFDAGVYLFAGNSFTRDDPESIQDLVRFFEANGMGVVDLMPLGGASVKNVLAEYLADPYGIIVLLFAGIVALAQLIVMLIHAALFRERLLVAAVLGAETPHLRRIVSQRLRKLVVSGIATGSVLSLAIVLRAEGLALAGLETGVLTVLVALAVSTVTSILMCQCVAWREGRRVARAVPC